MNDSLCEQEIWRWFKIRTFIILIAQPALTSEFVGKLLLLPVRSNIEIDKHQEVLILFD